MTMQEQLSVTRLLHRVRSARRSPNVSTRRSPSSAGVATRAAGSRRTRSTRIPARRSGRARRRARAGAARLPRPRRRADALDGIRQRRRRPARRRVRSRRQGPRGSCRRRHGADRASRPTRPPRRSASRLLRALQGASSRARPVPRRARTSSGAVSRRTRSRARGSASSRPPIERERRSRGRRVQRRRRSQPPAIVADSRWPGRLCGAWRTEYGRIGTLWARTLDGETAAETRYLYLRGASRTNLPPYGLSEVLAGSHDARRELVLVEGFIDFHQLRARGFENVAALGGTSTNPRTFERLSRLGVETRDALPRQRRSGTRRDCRAPSKTRRAHSAARPSTWSARTVSARRRIRTRSFRVRAQTPGAHCSPHANAESVGAHGSWSPMSSPMDRSPRDGEALSRAGEWLGLFRPASRSSRKTPSASSRSAAATRRQPSSAPSAPASGARRRPERHPSFRGISDASGGLRDPGVLLPRLIDQRGIADELGVTRAAAEKIMRQVPKVHVPGLRKVYVKRDDVVRMIEEGTRR